MKFVPLVFALALGLGCSAAPAADLPTVSIDHLYFLRARATYLRKLDANAMVEYCLAQKLGGRSFEDLYAQLFTMQIDLAKLLKVEGAPADDPRVKLLNKTYDAYFILLRDEAQKIQSGLVREGQIASEALEAIARDQAATR